MAIQIGRTTVIDNSRNLTNIASIFSCTGIASQSEAQAGTSSTKLMTPLRVAQAIAALAGGGGSVINRIQRGSTSWITPTAGTPLTYVVPITPVNLSKAFMSQGCRTDWKAEGATGAKSTTTASARINAPGASISITTGTGGLDPVNPAALQPSGIVDWEVIEFV